MARFGQAARGTADEITIAIDLEPLMIALGAAQALAHMTDDKVYIDALLDTAFEEVEQEFNREADAYAKTGAISHMYEWGTVGINPAKTNMRLQPSNPAAKLWSHYTIGSGMDRTIGFIYRPSVANVPKPTTGKTGMSQNVIESMRDYQFTWKAKVMEEGEQVLIRPKRRFLLIPRNEETQGWYGWRTNDINRGYMLVNHNIATYPGRRRYAGNFTSFWYSFWEDRAGEMLDKSVAAMIESDYYPEIVMPRSPSKMRPVGTFLVKAEVEKNKKAVQKRANAKARLRRARLKKKAKVI